MATPDPRDISELQKAVNDASSRTTALWVSFMTFAAYLIVAAGSVNHLALFRETAIRLPVLNADLPLVAFFAIAPLFLILFHFYLFLNLVTLARRIATYNSVLVAAVPEEDDRNLLRSRLDTFLVVQLLSKPSKSRTGINVWLLYIVVWITLVGLPILILLQFQLTFLPYHLSFVTWIHRFFIVADLALIWFFWFAIYRRGELHFPKLGVHPAALGGSLAVIGTSLVVVAYPGERLGQLVRVKLPVVCSEKLVPISDCFLHGPVNMVTGQPQRYFFNVLVLPFQTLTDLKKIETGQTIGSLRGRDLAGAILIESDLRSMDFTGTNLDGARLDNARASGASFGCADTGVRASGIKELGWPDHGCSSLRGASLAGANLAGAQFIEAYMEGSVLIDANLSGARLNRARLEAAVLTNANLTAAEVKGTSLKYAYLFNANLSGATFKESELGGALLERSKFEFASLGQFGSVRVGNTVGRPNLSFAAFDLDGSSEPSLAEVASFNNMRNRMLNVLREEEMHRRNVSVGSEQYVSIDPAQFNPYFSILTPGFYEAYYSAGEKTNWGELKGEVTDQWIFVKDTPAYKAIEDMENMKRQFLAERFAELACDGENAPFVARGLISNDAIVRLIGHDEFFLAKVRNNPNCRGTAELKPKDFGAIELLRLIPKDSWFPDKTEIRQREK
jgi:uncharacterized protein YjbI with pentapeptide repeats